MFFGHITPMEAYICQLLPSSKNFSSSELCLAVAVTAYYFSHLQDLFLASSFFFFFLAKVLPHSVFFSCEDLPVCSSILDIMISFVSPGIIA